MASDVVVLRLRELLETIYNKCNELWEASDVWSDAVYDKTEDSEIYQDRFFDVLEFSQDASIAASNGARLCEELKLTGDAHILHEFGDRLSKLRSDFGNFYYELAGSPEKWWKLNLSCGRSISECALSLLHFAKSLRDSSALEIEKPGPLTGNHNENSPAEDLKQTEKQKQSKPALNTYRIIQAIEEGLSNDAVFARLGPKICRSNENVRKVRSHFKQGKYKI